MADSILGPYYELMLAVAVGMARIYPIAYMVPAFCYEHVKGVVRHSIVFALGMVPAPGIRQALIADEVSGFAMAGLVAKELVVGLLLGALLSIPFWLYESVGALLDNQRGALMGGQLNPALGSDVTPIGHLFKETTVLLLLAMLGLHTLVQVIWDSYLVWPPTVWFPLPAADGFDVFLGMIAAMFNDMMLYSAPFIGLLLLVEFGMALFSLYSPQLQVFILSMPAKSLIGLVFLVLYLPTLWDVMVNSLWAYGGLRHVLAQLLRVP